MCDTKTSNFKHIPLYTYILKYLKRFLPVISGSLLLCCCCLKDKENAVSETEWRAMCIYSNLH